MKKAIIALLLVASAAASASDLGQLYEKAYFLETAKGQTEKALELYAEIIKTDATDENRQTIIQAAERMLVLHRRQRYKTLQEKVNHFDMHPKIVDHITETFGKPEAYLGSSKVYTKKNLPERNYEMAYPNDFIITVMGGKIYTLSFTQPIYHIRDVTVGTDLSRVLEVFPPDLIITEKQLDRTTKPGVLYDNHDSGSVSYETKAGVRFFFIRGKIYAMYLLDTELLKSVLSKPTMEQGQ